MGTARRNTWPNPCSELAVCERCYVLFQALSNSSRFASLVSHMDLLPWVLCIRCSCYVVFWFRTRLGRAHPRLSQGSLEPN